VPSRRANNPALTRVGVNARWVGAAVAGSSTAAWETIGCRLGAERANVLVKAFPIDLQFVNARANGLEHSGAGVECRYDARRLVLSQNHPSAESLRMAPANASTFC
jgi:hypothetical protein